MVPLALALASVLTCGGSDDEPEYPLPELTPFTVELAESVHEIRDGVADERNLEKTDGIIEGTLTRDELTAYYEGVEAMLSDEEREEMRSTTAAYRILGMIGPEDDLWELMVGMLSEGVAGLYSPEENKLVLVDDGDASFSTDDEFTLAHEYVHALQDAEFDFDHFDDLREKQFKDKANTEYGMTIEALYEGDAMLAAVLYLEEKLGGEELQEWFDSQDAEEADGEDYPPAVERYLTFSYNYGAEFVIYLLSHGGWEKVNAAYDKLPKTTEQIMHPRKYVEGEIGRPIELPDLSDSLGEGWEQQADWTFGEFDVYNLVMTHLDDDEAASEAADGWDGGRMAVYLHDGDEERAVVHIVLGWDTRSDAEEAYSALHPALTGRVVGDSFPWNDWIPPSDTDEVYIFVDFEECEITVVAAVEPSDRDAAWKALSPGPE